MKKNMTFLFMDECEYDPLDLSALTGVLVPLESYSTVRDAVGKIIWDVLSPHENTVPQPIELHARDLLSQLSDHAPEEHDKLRLGVITQIVKIANQHELHVLRYAYLNRSEISCLMKGDPKLYGLNFSNMLFALQDVLENTIVLPVMDGIPSFKEGASKPPRIVPRLVSAFAQTVRFTHHMRNNDSIANNLSIRNFHNLAEPVFSDSTYSVLLQLTDLISHLLLQIEKDELEPHSKRSAYQSSVISQAKQLSPDLIHAWKGKMDIKM